MRYSYPILLILAVVLAACGGAAPTVLPTQPAASQPTATTQAEATQPPAGTTDLTGTQWQLVSFGPAGSETPVVGEQPITLEFGSDGKIGGSAGCNSYGADLRIESGALVVGQIVRTLMACADEQVNQQENQYLEALQSAGAFEISGDRLVIQYGDGRGVLTFELAGP